MPYPRTPDLKAAITGADKVHPARFAKRSQIEPTPLGEPTFWLRGNERVAWEMFQKELPWLMESDRVIVEIACSIRGGMIDGRLVGYQALTLLKQCAGQMGATPADRSKIMVQGEPEKDATDRFFN